MAINNKKIICIFFVLLFAAICAGILLTPEIPMPAAEDNTAIVPYDSSMWVKLDDGLIADRAEAADFKPVDEVGSTLSDNGSYFLDSNRTIKVTLNAPEDGSYYLAFSYKQPRHLIIDSSITVKTGLQTVKATTNTIWTDSTKDYPNDRFGSEFLSTQVAVDEFTTDYMRQFDAIKKDPVAFDLKSGQNEITITCNTQSLDIKEIILVKKAPITDYNTYRAGIPNQEITDDLITIEAENYAAKSHSYISPSNIQDAGLHPYDIFHKKLNVIGGLNEGSGYKLLWTFKTEKSGNYQLAFHYKQSFKKDIPAFGDIEIDGKPLFAEMNSIAFPYNGDDFDNLVFTDDQGNPYRIWLEAGVHTIALNYNGAVMQDAVNELKSVMQEINDAGVEIKKVSGVSNDINRVWDINQYFPGILDQMQGWQDRLERVYEQLGSLQDQKPTGALNLKLAQSILKKLASEPDKIPVRLSELNEGSGSAAQLIGDLIPDLCDQVFVLDRLYLYGNQDLPAANASYWTKLKNGIKFFFYSFSEDSKGNSTVTKASGDELDIWVSGSVSYVEMLQRLADAEFTTKYGYKVRFSLLSDDNKLLLAKAAETGPDAALGIASHLPFQLAMRGALEDFTQFDDFAPFVYDNFNPNVETPYIFQDKVYGITERQDFYVQMYRKDILQKLNLKVPETWEDVQNIMPTLRRQGMNYYIPLSSSVGLKPFYATLPFIFQKGGELYSNDGMRSLIGSREAMDGFKLMTDLYNVYALDKQSANFYSSFRYGTLPIGVGGFSDYLMIKLGAPEIADLWDIAPAPGVRNPDGTINREFMSASKADVIMKGADTERSWEFIKWWLSAETQIRYATSMQTQYGPEFLWNTANLKAFEQQPIEANHIAVIMEQYKSIKEPPSHPATYMLERELSNAWIDVVMNGKPSRVAIDKAIVNVNREILRKLGEFGYVKNGEKVKDFKISTIEEILGKP